MVESVGETFFRDLVYGPFMLNVDLWKERNSRIFEDREIYVSQLLDGFFISSFHWCRRRGFTTSSSTIDFISSLSDITLTYAHVNS